MSYTHNVIKIEDSDDEGNLKRRELRSVNGTRFQEITLLNPEPIKRWRIVYDTSDPKYRKPFKFGWRRELVYRSTMSAFNINADVYYITPAGTKVRSMRDVSIYLKSRNINNLTTDNFIFGRVALGMDDPELEIIRNANKRATPRKLNKTEKNMGTRTKRRCIQKEGPASPPQIKAAPKPLSDSKASPRRLLVVKASPKSPSEPEAGFNQNITTIKPKAIEDKAVKTFRAVTDPGLRKPFLYNWKREVIFRTRDDDPNRRVDTNYITPMGRRVRTMKEIADYLKETRCIGLSISNFTFCSGPLGLNDPMKEIIIKAYLYEMRDNKVVQQNVPQVTPAPPLQDPKLLKPFLYRWKREVVYRFAQERPKHIADVYYYAPTGEKLRSMIEIAQYLTRTKCKDLDVENFIFFKRPLGVNDPEKETIRSADINIALKKINARISKQNSSVKVETDQQTKAKRKYTRKCT